MDGFLSFLTGYYIIDGMILLMGLFALFIMVDRAKALYFDLSIDTDKFMQVVTGLVREDKIEEAVAFCAANDTKPLAYVMKRILEKAGYDYSEMTHALDTAASETAPRMVKRLGHLSMVANVATLIGLLGTVLGLIMSFKAVSFADVSQRQALLVDGISIAMHATAMGLLVAIPVMVAYSFLHDKQNKLFADIDRCTNQVLEQLRMRDLVPANTETMYPQMSTTPKNADASIKTKTPPPPKVRAS